MNNFKKFPASVSIVFDVFNSPELAKGQTENFFPQMMNEYFNGVHEITIVNEELLCEKFLVSRPI